MATEQYESPDDQMRAAIAFMQRANQASDMAGACVLESWTCPHCRAQQWTAHGFCETLKCGQCGKTTASKVPRIPQPGEVSKEALQEAIRLVRMTFPEIGEDTRKWIDAHEGAMRCVSTAYACLEVHRALNLVEEYARKMSGGHTA